VKAKLPLYVKDMNCLSLLDAASCNFDERVLVRLAVCNVHGCSSDVLLLYSELHHIYCRYDDDIDALMCMLI